MHSNLNKLAVAIMIAAPLAMGAIAPMSAHAAANLVQNGDFELGNTGFTSGYSYYPNGSSNSGSGHDYYQIGTDARADNALWVPLSDHTTGSGNYMYVDGSTTANTQIWGQSIGVQTGKTYQISGYFSSLYPVSDPTIKYTIGGNDATSTFDLNSPGTWQQHSFLWTATSNTLNLGLVDTNLEAGGNDFAIDDLSVKAVPEASTVVLFSLMAMGGLLILRKRSSNNIA